MHLRVRCAGSAKSVVSGSVRTVSQRRGNVERTPLVNCRNGSCYGHLRGVVFSNHVPCTVYLERPGTRHSNGEWEPLIGRQNAACSSSKAALAFATTIALGHRANLLAIVLTLVRAWYNTVAQFPRETRRTFAPAIALCNGSNHRAAVCTLNRTWYDFVASGAGKTALAIATTIFLRL